ncbi:MAG: hypothetical protein WDN76_11110 [Alphaproteobacteria bacterium]
MKNLLLIAIAAAALSGCAMLSAKPVGAVAPTAESRPSGPIELGDYEKAPEGSIASMFAKQIAARYREGAPLAGAMKDLEGNKFGCAAPKAGGGDPPDQVCRRVLKAGGCSYTYQVHLFDDPGKKGLSRVRGLYDKACGEDLLGG